ncbi:hypothetical protein JBL43_06995 [Aureibaculum sp. A20]|uniref:Uncharacterized protein n=1 Tax=Aureibaculum flavum TaxID=2795986 RepID=A0ABS0WPT4_9FLAO|nr:hemopexin repeat-containing protein [Aureibaculum flavum]MBJ2173977.1 hypothetical protein [Aureibaculum flavum]
MKKQIKLAILLSLVVVFMSFTSDTKEDKLKTTKLTANFGQLKAALKTSTGKAYFFTDKNYYRHNLSTNKLEKSAVINGNFKGLANGIDAALLHTNGKGYFFKGSTYYRYNFSTSKVDKTGKIGIDGWKGMPSNIDAAVVHTNGKAYFFKGSTYYRYNSSTNKMDKKAAISASWKGVPNNVDAALWHTNGKIYFFKGNTYYRYNIGAKKVDKTGTIGKDGWKGLSFAEKANNVPSSTKDNIRLKITLTRIKSIQARDSDNIADFVLEQKIHYTTKGKQKLAIKKKINVGKNIINTGESYHVKDESSSIFNAWQTHVREGDENHFINNSLVYEITPEEIKDKYAEFQFYTNLGENDGSNDNWFTKNIFKLFQDHTYKIKTIASQHLIDVKIHEVIDYLQNPTSSKYDKSYFKGGRNGDMHEYGAFGDVMWFKKGSNNSLIGHLEYGANNKETYVRLYYRFELVY